MKDEESDMLKERNCCRNLQNSCCGISVRQIKKLAVYLSIAAAAIVFLYYCIWMSNIGHSFAAYDEFFIENDSPFDAEMESDTFDQLLHYIFHPQASCETSVVLGSQVGVNKKLDGDKIVCLEPGPGLAEECIVYSFGINHEWSFEENLHQEFGCNVYAFDPSMNISDHLHSNGVWFSKQGIGTYNYKVTVHGQVWEENTLDSIMDQLSHGDKTIDLLKMNIGGSEFEILEDILDKGLLNRINHLCVEVNLLAYPYWTEILNLLQRIDAESGLKHFSTRKKQVSGFPELYEQYVFEMAWYRSEEDDFGFWVP